VASLFLEHVSRPQLQRASRLEAAPVHAAPRIIAAISTFAGGSRALMQCSKWLTVLDAGRAATNREQRR
jgi:hypothetical protein